ncbi:thioredoxin [Psychrobacillus sp. AK 1817]|uniref:thioredoxin family protein n=1 Tax=Psychrobacillus sp. AK 1817 TaxID=2303505 RepID=UPI001247C535|nr:thioredoxin family protein [Psychrobacillus sp. AK 1817]QEY22276.1 thioredoxin [Psychrobacillus sp. AK 1817]
MKKIAIIGGVIVLVFVLIFVLNSQKNKNALEDNPYDTDNLKQSTIDLLDDPNYQNIILPKDLNEKIEKGETFTVYFFSPECSHCKEMTPRLTPIAEENNVEIFKYNILEYEQGWDDFNIKGTPTLVHFENGKEVARMPNAQPKENIQAFFDQVVLK